jgi:hypothetical protein
MKNKRNLKVYENEEEFESISIFYFTLSFLYKLIMLILQVLIKTLKFLG